MAAQQTTIRSGRRRPTQARSLATVEAILDAAAHILDNQGPGAFTTNLVAARAGVSIGSLYQYFANKDELLLALMRREYERLAEGLRRALVQTEGAPFEEAVAVMLDETVGSGRPSYRVMRAVEAECRRIGDLSAFAGVEAETKDLHDRFFRRFVRDDCSADEFDTASEDIVHLIHGIMRSDRFRPAPTPQALEVRLKRAIVGYLQPLLKQAGPPPEIHAPIVSSRAEAATEAE